MSVRNRVLGTVGTLTTAFMLSRDAYRRLGYVEHARRRDTDQPRGV